MSSLHKDELGLITESLAKADYPEDVVRRALYWMSDLADWELSDQDDAWEIQLRPTVDHPVDLKARFHRHLNDFLLRYQLDEKTDHLRERIVVQALKRLADAD